MAEAEKKAANYQQFDFEPQQDYKSCGEYSAFYCLPEQSCIISEHLERQNDKLCGLSTLASLQ